MEHIIRVFEKGAKTATVVEDISLGSIDDVYRWMEQNKNELYSVYKLDCILDLS